MFKTGFFIALVSLLVPLWLVYFKRHDYANIILSWKLLLREAEGNFGRIYVGINTCTDLIVSGVELLNQLEISPGPATDHTVLTSLEDLQEAFHYSFSKGVASERFFQDQDIFSQIVNASSYLNHSQWFVGGNAALIAHHMATLFPKANVQLIGPVGPKLLELLDSRLHVPSKSKQDKDEVHLIMEFHVGERWASSSARVATRFITSHDTSNSRADYLDMFFDELAEYKPHLVVLSGMHMLDGQEESLWRGRVTVLATRLNNIKTDLPVHMEMATMADERLLSMLVDEVIPLVTSLGMNEQELTFIARVKSNMNFTFEGQPPVEKVTQVLAWILNTYGRRDSSSRHRLSRVHFHCLSFHIIATLPNYWLHSDQSVAAGALTCALQACGDSDQELDSSQVELRLPTAFRLVPTQGQETQLNYDNPVLNYTYEGVNFVFSPVLVCKQPRKTVGLGDVISASSLMYTKYVIATGASKTR